jgi:hypothetical protein
MPVPTGRQDPFRLEFDRAQITLLSPTATYRGNGAWNDILTSEKLLLALGCLWGQVERSGSPRQ